jgi:carbon monoxide dehydrogenase subunit G
MRLDLSGAVTVDAPVSRVWTALLDHELVASCAPLVREVEEVDATRFRVVSGFGVGSIRLVFTLAVSLSDLVPDESLALHVRGKAPGTEVQVESTVRIGSIDDGHTRLEWTAAATFVGKVVSVGARLLQGGVRKVTEDFWDRFAAAVPGAGVAPSA